MLRQIKINSTLWIDWIDINKDELMSVVRHYDFHELDIEACLEENQRARIDYYEDYMFITLHFPKYNLKTQTYDLNEFNIFLWKDYIITFRSFPWTHVDKIFDYYSDLDETDNKIKVSSWFVLYEIIQAMLEKMFRVIEKNNIDVRKIEKDVFTSSKTSLVKNIMIKKRNIIMLKNMFKPQIVVLNQLEYNVNKLFAWKIEEYFEDLEDKLNQIVNEINLLDEYIASIEDAFKTMIDIKTNSVIKILTLFSAFLFPLTLVTWFYGMNVELPFQKQEEIVFGILFLSAFFMTIAGYFILRDNDKN